MDPQPVSASALEGLLADLRNSLPGGEQGIFGPASISWKINRESALFLAAGRAALLQLAHPWVAAAIVQHSRTLEDPIGRFHHTFRVIFTMVFGPAEQAFAVARALHRLHQGITGTLPDSAGRFGKGTAYLANEMAALRWVYATLVDSALLAYELLLPPLSQAEREEYISESRRMAALFGLAPEDLPQSAAEFSDYMQTVLQSGELGVSAATRAFAQRLQAGAGLLLPPPFWYRALTIELLPPRLREDYGFSYSRREMQAAKRALCWLRRLYARLPETLRFVGPYNEVKKRSKGGNPGMMVRLCNRLWIGQPVLLGVSTTPCSHPFPTVPFSPPSASPQGDTES